MHLTLLQFLKPLNRLIAAVNFRLHALGRLLLRAPVVQDATLLLLQSEDFSLKLLLPQTLLFNIAPGFPGLLKQKTCTTQSCKVGSLTGKLYHTLELLKLCLHFVREHLYRIL